MKNKPLLVFFIILFLLSFFIILFSSAVYLFEKKSSIYNLIYKKITYSNNEYKNSEKIERDRYWANKILEGGYILHFRHAERDKWIDVEMYDALESDLHKNGLDESRYAENDYFENAVCLNSRGKIQARAMGEHIKHIGLPIGKVFSSVSCRARQTAELSFGGYHSLHRILVHESPYNEDEEQRISKLKEFYLNLPIEDNKNTIVSAHNSVIRCEMLSDKCEKLNLEEGGFFVLSKSGNYLILEHEFHFFADFMRVFYKR